MKRIIKETETGYFGYLVDIPGVCAQGYTKDEVREKLKSYLSLYLNFICNT